MGKVSKEESKYLEWTSAVMPPAVPTKVLGPRGSRPPIGAFLHLLHAPSVVRGCGADSLPVIGSPPCTAFSLWNRGINYKKMPIDEVRRRISEGRKHLNFMVSLYRKQLARGKHFLHEHPQSAASWMDNGIKS